MVTLDMIFINRELGEDLRGRCFDRDREDILSKGDSAATATVEMASWCILRG